MNVNNQQNTITMKHLKKTKMTPKEKAHQLYNKMVVDFSIDHWQTKQCALVAVDEIIDALDKSLIDADIEWWKEVKQEIEKL
jgi:hypothetical protein